MSYTRKVHGHYSDSDFVLSAFACMISSNETFRTRIDFLAKTVTHTIKPRVPFFKKHTY